MLTRVLALLLISVLALSACGESPPATPTLMPVVPATPTWTPAAKAVATADLRLEENKPISGRAIETVQAKMNAGETKLVDEAMRTADNVLKGLKAAGLPIEDITVSTNKTNPLLGSKGLYMAESTWHDTRLPATRFGDCELQVFLDAARAKAYAAELQEGQAKAGDGVEYLYLRGTVLLRVSQNLTPAQAEEYRQAFESLSIP